MLDSPLPLDPDPAWARALTFAERLRALREAGPVPSDLDRARRRDARWRAQASLTEEAQIAARLAEDDATASEWFQVLGETPEARGSSAIAGAPWVETLAHALASPRSDAPASDGAAALLELFRPMIDRARAALREGATRVLDAHPDAPFTIHDAESALSPALMERLLELATRTLVLELNVARVEGRLDGATPEARFQSFVRSLATDAIARQILAEYPVLARQVAIACDQWTEAGVELLDRLAADAAVLADTFAGGRALSPLRSIRSSGDRHRGGRSVAMLAFADGLRFVYKPRSLSIDRHFAELVAWARARGLAHDLVLPIVIDRDAYGWVEQVRAASCESPAEVRRFYERQGIYLALFYALNATDFHSENLIARGEHPVPIDLEALLHPPPELGVHDSAAGDALASSVVRIGLLPQWIWADDDSAGVEISGLGGTKGQLSPRPVAYPTELGTDAMHFTSGRLAMRDNDNRPRLLGHEVDVLEHTDAIEASFAATYRLLLTHRRALLAADGPLAHFADDEVRVILRPTRLYALLLQGGAHPDLLRDGLDRERLFDKLWVSSAGQPSLTRIIGDERQDLHRADIPVFTTRPGTRDLWTGPGRRIEGFFDAGSLDGVRRRVEALSEVDLARQRWLIQASFSALVPPEARPRVRSSEVETNTRAPAGDPRLLDAAHRIGARLEALSLRTSTGDGVAITEWLGLSLASARRWSVLPLGLDLYAGTPGVALFLAYLGAHTGDASATTLAEEALGTLRRAVANDTSLGGTPGAFDGWSGVVYALAHLGSLWDRPALLDEAEAIVARFAPRVREDRAFDIIGGCAGAIGALLALLHVRPTTLVHDAAIACGDHLLANATPMVHGLGWASQAAGAIPISGFSHGAAGIAWALLRLAAASGDARFHAAAREALRHERTLFSPSARNWRDLRSEGDKESFGLAWCHGAPGIGLARLSTLALLDDEEVRAEIAAATRTTLEHGFGGSHSLCHGELGNVELLATAARILENDTLAAHASARTGAILESIAARGVVCGMPRSIETPGLMTGLAGVGWGLLRAHNPARIPSVLVLDPPVLRAAREPRPERA